MFRLLSFLLITGLSQSFGEISREIDCKDLQDFNWITYLILKYSKKVVRDDDFQVNFIISTDKNKNLVRVNPGDWSWLQDSWDRYQKTSVIIHGFKSSGEKSWVTEMARKLIENRKCNVIIVNWNGGSNLINYADAAKNTQITSKKVARFLYDLKRELDKLEEDEGNTLWNHFHFIGHSLGAQISAQTSFILKWYGNFWHVDRITGLDPAKPCFNKDTVHELKLDKSDADFVDVIHTQVGLGGSSDAFGLKQPIGHMDFYVNSGVVQPKCLGSVTLKEETMVCSHKLATKYFLQTLNLPKNDTCALRGYPWDGTFLHAQDALTERLAGVCYDCPEMGIYADQSNRNGTYLVLTGENEPFCELGKNDDEVNNIVKVFWKFKGTTPIFDL